MEGLGRLFNIGFTMDDVYVNLRDADAVTFVCHLTAGDTFTVTEATTAAGGSAAALATVTQFYTTPVGGGSVWTKTTQAAGSTVVTAAGTAAHVAVVTIHSAELSDGFDYVKVASTSTGTVMAILHDLKVQRTPPQLAAVAV